MPRNRKLFHKECYIAQREVSQYCAQGSCAGMSNKTHERPWGLQTMNFSAQTRGKPTTVPYRRFFKFHAVEVLWPLCPTMTTHDTENFS
jgi:hypothetical protein